MNVVIGVMIGLVLGLGLGAALAWLAARSRTGVLGERLDAAQRELQASAALRQENEQLKIQCAELRRDRQADAEKLQWVEQAQQQLREAFQALAGQALQTNAQEFLNRARERLETVLGAVRGDWNTQKAQMEKLVQPLESSLKSLDAQVRELEQKREGAYQSLGQQLHQLASEQKQLHTAAIKLEQALKSSTVRGSWGQVQLRRVVELAGMQDRVDFAEQVTGVDGGRPDLVVHLPNHSLLPVDAKAPLSAYLEAVECADAELRKAKLQQFAKAVRGRVAELGAKKYWEQFEHAPEFVAMFVPNESSLSAAFEADPALLEYAFEQKVLLTSPVTLLALLKAVAYGWQQQQIAENARQIAAEAGELYGRISTFTEHLAGCGSNLDSAVDSYNKAVGSLERSVLPAARRCQKLGVASAELPVLEPVEAQARQLRKLAEG